MKLYIQIFEVLNSIQILLSEDNSIITYHSYILQYFYNIKSLYYEAYVLVISFKVFIEFLHWTASVTAQVEMTPYDIPAAYRVYESARPSAISSISLLSAQSQPHHLKKPRGDPRGFS